MVWFFTAVTWNGKAKPLSDAYLFLKYEHVETSEKKEYYRCAHKMENVMYGKEILQPG